MKILSLLSENNIAANVTSVSKKAALESICKLATQGISGVSEKEVLNALIDREKLGSTAIGFGVALPHARLSGLNETHAALVRLNKPINFDAPDDEFVDLLFALLIPYESTDEHLKIMSELAELFTVKSFREQLRNAKSSDDIVQILKGVI